ncbi:MAG: hypothetical protein QME32_02080 [Endomicrobiia bacterium]|nr:hypothetical protein [Endomicrobiia bacterium]
MKRFIMVFTAMVLAVSSQLRAATFDEFANEINNKAQSVIETRLNALAADLGAAISQTGFHQTATIGGTLPGFDLGAHVAYKNVSSNNVIFKSAGVDLLVLPVIQMEVGLPIINLDILARYATFDRSTLVGGGLRYSIFKTLPFDVTALTLYNALNVDAGVNKLSASVITGSLGVNFNVPIISPYVAVSFDSVSLTPDVVPVVTYKGVASLTRVDAGFNLSLMPFTYLNLGGSYFIAEEASVGYRGGLGIKF